MKRVCIVGCGAIGSLYAAHLARVAQVYAFVRRSEHARALTEQGLTVSGTHQFHSRLQASHRPDQLPAFDLGIVATKAVHTEEAFSPVGHLFDQGAVVSAQNGLGGEEVLAGLTRGKIIRATTFMSGHRRNDTHVVYELDTPTWLGPYEETQTPLALVREAAALIQAGGLKAEALADARPAQWSKLIFNASVNSVAALTRLPHCPAFADVSRPDALGHLLRELIEEGCRVAQELGIELHDDPWKMNQVGAQTNHPPSMLNDVRDQNRTEIDFLGGAIWREAEKGGVDAPLHRTLYRLVKGLELSFLNPGSDPVD